MGQNQQIEHIQTPVISLKSVWAGYEDDIILEDVNLDVYKRDYIGLIGPNGGGKTTLIRVILGLIKPKKGEITIMGSSAPSGRKYIGYVPQLQIEDKDFPASVWDVVQMGRLSKGSLLKPRSILDDAIVEDKLRLLDLLNLRSQSMGDLSGGQRQRVYIARALATEPQILLLDEPTASVDPEASNNIYEVLRILNEQVTILLISHDMTAISAYVKTVGCVNRRLFYHGEKQLSIEMIMQGYNCPVDLIAHGVPHRVFHQHAEDGTDHD